MAPPAKSTTQRAPSPDRKGKGGRSPGAPTRSTRAYRRQVDELIDRARRGLISWRECREGTAAIQIATQMLLNEILMKTENVPDVEPDHVLGVNGGFKERKQQAIIVSVTETSVDEGGNEIKKVYQDVVEADDPRDDPRFAVVDDTDDDDPKLIEHEGPVTLDQFDR